MKIQARWLFEAAGAALLISLPYYVQILYPRKIALYHHHLHQANLTFGILLAILAVTLIGFAFIVYLQNRFKPVPRAIFGAAIAGTISLRAVDVVLFLILEWQINEQSDDRSVAYGASFLASASRFCSNLLLRLAVPIAFAAVAAWKPGICRRFMRATRYSLAGMALCLLWIVPELLRFALTSRPATSAEASLVRAPSRAQKRIVWILFDELSYNYVFDHPPRGMDFPNFRNLGSRSTSFTQITPVGFSTDRIVPSLLTGKEIHDIMSNSQGMLFYVDPALHSLQALDPNQTLFGLAHANGWSPGIVGWYNPYCRIFRSVLTACWWGPGAQARILAEAMGASETRSPLANAAVLVPAFLFEPTANRSQAIRPQRHANFLESMARAHHLLQDQSVHFIFLHMSVPHPPGFYDRKTHKFCECGNYLDNLALADDTLAALMHDIDQTPEKDQTTVIVSSDHSWRVPLWRSSDDWTPEEENLTQGRFDDRPVFLVHFPGQTSSSQVASPTSELLEHDIVAAMLQDKLQTPADLQAFMQSRSSTTYAVGSQH